MSATDPRDTLDPDEVDCPRCAALVGQVCRQPNGRKARAIHRERRELASSIERTPDEQERAPTEQGSRSAKTKKSNPKGPPATRESRSKGGKAKAANARRERAEIEALLVDAKARALAHKADELAEDAIDYDRRRMALKRLVLDSAVGAWATFAEAVEGYARIQTDEQGKPLRELIETDRGRVTEILDRRGTFGPDDVKALASAAGMALEKLRLEEGSATTRGELNLGGLPPGVAFGEVTDPELKSFMDRAQAVVDEALGEGETP